MKRIWLRSWPPVLTTFGPKPPKTLGRIWVHLLVAASRPRHETYSALDETIDLVRGALGDILRSLSEDPSQNTLH